MSHRNQLHDLIIDICEQSAAAPTVSARDSPNFSTPPPEPPAARHRLHFTGSVSASGAASINAARELTRRLTDTALVLNVV